MDPLTHGVASFALQRAFFPRLKFLPVIAIILAGILPDADWFTVLVSPSAYFLWHRSLAHSLIGSLGVALFAMFLSFGFILSFGLANWNGVFLPIASGKEPQSEGGPKPPLHELRAFLVRIFAACFVSVLLHLALDACQSDGVALLWPFSTRRFALDLLPGLDPWLLAIFALAILLPELFRLVGEEIGSRNRAPRGRNGAIIGFAFMALYLGYRAVAHGNAVAALEAHTVAGEMPRRAAAFPDSTSPFLWHSIVETESTINLVELRSTGGEVTDASGVTTLHKPEPSPVLNAAQKSPPAIVFVKFARFPKATVEKEEDGYSVEIQDVKDQAIEGKSRAIFADITVDKNARVVSSELQWQRNSPTSR